MKTAFLPTVESTDGVLGYSRRESDCLRVGVGAEVRQLDESQRGVPRSISQQTRSGGEGGAERALRRFHSHVKLIRCGSHDPTTTHLLAISLTEKNKPSFHDASPETHIWIYFSYHTSHVNVII